MDHAVDASSAQTGAERVPSAAAAATWPWLEPLAQAHGAMHRHEYEAGAAVAPEYRGRSRAQ